MANWITTGEVQTGFHWLACWDDAQKRWRSLAIVTVRRVVETGRLVVIPEFVPSEEGRSFLFDSTYPVERFSGDGYRWAAIEKPEPPVALR